MKITFLHTSSIHINRFDKIIKELQIAAKVEHFVAEELLEAATKQGKIDKNGFEEVIVEIKKSEPDFIICTCSTYGNLCDESQSVYRIDKPVGEFIVSNYTTVGIAFTANSTKEISIELIQNIALKANKSIELIEIDCSHCWAFFEKGDFDKYESEIAKHIQKESSNSEAIFLAQASMEGAKKYLNNESFNTYSSPRFGVNSYLQLLCPGT